MLKHETIIRQMTLEEKCYLFSGKDFWQTRSVERLGIHNMVLSDGPHGVRRQAGAGDQLGLNPSLPATCFPTAATIANSWDPKLGEEIGECLGEEAASQGVGVLLGPGLNIKRSPLCGRNFEYFSEDPYLAGKIAAGYIRGIQKNGVAACPKHFACNSQELRRMASDSVLDERTLREIYLTGFEIAVKEGKAKSLMSSYNRVNGTYANENYHLLQEILRDEWGFDGFVVSDWGGSNEHIEGVRAGSHLEMPTTGGDSDLELIQAVRSGKISEEIINRRVDEILDVILPVTKVVAPLEGKPFDIDAHHKMAAKAALDRRAEILASELLVGDIDRRSLGYPVGERVDSLSDAGHLHGAEREIALHAFKPCGVEAGGDHSLADLVDIAVVESATVLSGEVGNHIHVDETAAIVLIICYAL